MARMPNCRKSQPRTLRSRTLPKHRTTDPGTVPDSTGMRASKVPRTILSASMVITEASALTAKGHRLWVL